MALLNCSLNFLGYLDEPSNANPMVRMTDLQWSLQGLPVGKFKNVGLNLAPGESYTAISTLRTLSYTSGTSFDVSIVPETSRVRLAASCGFRTSRPSGDATTEWEISVVNGLVKMRFTGTGSAPTFGSMVAGDDVFLGTAFSTYNQGIFNVVKVGSDFIQFTNALASAETVAAQAKVFSNGPVQAGDILDVSSSAFSFPNQGQFPVVAVTDQWVEFTNVNAVPETVTGVAALGVSVYTESYRWMLMATDQKVLVNLNGDTGTGLVVEPTAPGDLVKNPGLLLKRGNVTKIEVTNPGQSVVRGFVVLAE